MLHCFINMKENETELKMTLMTSFLCSVALMSQKCVANPSQNTSPTGDRVRTFRIHPKYLSSVDWLFLEMPSGLSKGCFT